MSLRQGLSRIGTKSALFYGSLVHAVLEAHYGVAGGFDPDSQELHELIDLQALALREGEVGVNSGFEIEVDTAHVMIPEYIRHWVRSDSRKRWLQLESRFEIPFQMPSGKMSKLRGMIDGVYLNRRKIWLLETKTASRFEEGTLLDRLSFELQVCFYQFAMKQMCGIRPSGVLYNILRKPQLRRTQKESAKVFYDRVRTDVRTRPDWYFARFEIRLTPREMQRWEAEFSDLLVDFEDWCCGGRTYCNTGECDGKYGACEFLPLCGRGERMHYRERDVHFPELAGE